MTCFHFAFPWFNHLHFVLLKLLLLGLCYPPLASSVKKQLLPPKYNITRIKKLEFGFFFKRARVLCFYANYKSFAEIPLKNNQERKKARKI